MVQLTDTLDGTTTARICADGSLVADVRAARVGIQVYNRSETDAPADYSKDTVAVYRPEEEVFHKDSMASFAAAPFTIDHPSAPVDANNWKQLGAGEVNGDVIRDGGFVRVPVIVRDARSVEAVRTTHKQLSMGYSCTLDWTPGTAPDGQAYDAVQRQIRINHIAAVPAARGGPELKISDERTPTNPKEDRVKVINLDGMSVNLSDATAAEQAIATLDNKLTAANDTAKAAQTDHDKAMAAKDAEIDKLKDEVVDQAQIDALADAKSAVVTRAKTLVGDKLADTAGKSVADVRRMACDAKGIDTADKSDDYVEARFDALTADTGTVQNISPGHPVNDTQARDAAREEYIARISGQKKDAA